MFSLRRSVPRALLSRPLRTTPFSTTTRALASEGNDPSFQEKGQVQAEKAAKDPEKMKNLGDEANKKRDDPHKTDENLDTPGIAGKTQAGHGGGGSASGSESIGRNVHGKASG